MKKQLVTFLLIILTWSVNGQTTATRKVLLSLQPGEKIMYAESCLSLRVNNQVYLVTHLNDQIYVYENGQRRGPYDDMDEAGVKSCREEADWDSRCSIYQPAPGEFDPAIVSTSDEGQYFINLNNKKYGPYPIISDLHVWPDKSGFVALASGEDMKIHVITSEGLNLALDGEVERMNFSPAGKKFIFAMKERPTMDAEILKMDFSKMSQEEIMAFAKKQEEKTKNAAPLQSYVFVNGTKKLGPYKHDAFFSNNPGFTKTGGDNWIMIINNELYINGVKTNTLPDGGIDPCNVWLSRDGKKYAVLSYDKIYFSDGKVYENPLEPSAVEKDGKITVRWATLENEKDLVVYSREL